MNHFRTSQKTQDFKGQVPYFTEPSAGVCLQNTYDYSPFGVSLDGRTVEGDFYRRGFNGMEKDDEVKGEGNSIDFGARMYDPRLGRWLSLHPILKHHESPFSCFSNNPITNIDPDGMDTLDVIKANGKIRNYTKGGENDVFRIVDDNGKVLEKLSVKAGAISNKWAYNDEKNKKNDLDVIQMKDDGESGKVFEFIAKNTKVEWSYITASYGAWNQSFLTTSHAKSEEIACVSLMNKKLIPKGWVIKKDIHSHPGNTEYPSGSYKYIPREDEFEIPRSRGEWGDTGFAKSIGEKYKNKKPKEKPIVFQIFIASTGKYINYTKDSKLSDYR
jgi:RHS repeat-associated protein